VTARGRTKASLSLICRNKCDANHVAKQHRKALANQEVIEKYGRPVRARTAGLHRVNCVLRKLNPFACLALPFLTSHKRARNWLVLVTSFVGAAVMPSDRDSEDRAQPFG
jgi:hypothetical protein